MPMRSQDGAGASRAYTVTDTAARTARIRGLTDLSSDGLRRNRRGWRTLACPTIYSRLASSGTIANQPE